MFFRLSILSHINYCNSFPQFNIAVPLCPLFILKMAKDTHTHTHTIKELQAQRITRKIAKQVVFLKRRKKNPENL